MRARIPASSFGVELPDRFEVVGDVVGDRALSFVESVTWITGIGAIADDAQRKGDRPTDALFFYWGASNTVAEVAEAGPGTLDPLGGLSA